MFFLHQIINLLINPIVVVLGIFGIGLILLCKGRTNMGKRVVLGGAVLLFLMSWSPLVDVLGIWLEKEYPPMKAEACPDADVIIVLGGGVGTMPAEVNYPYPLLSDAGDRVWHGARLWHALKVRNPAKVVKMYCTGPDVSLTTPSLLRDFAIPEGCVVAVDGPHNTEEEARTLEGLFRREEHAELPTFNSELQTARPKALLVTSALHMKRAMRIFGKYAPGLEVIPIATDHHFVADPVRFRRWQYWFPKLDALVGFSMIEHELIGILRYIW